jgi:hypothetical protein
MKKLIFILILLALAAFVEKPEDHGWQTGDKQTLSLAGDQMLFANDFITHDFENAGKQSVQRQREALTPKAKMVGSGSPHSGHKAGAHAG